MTTQERSLIDRYIDNSLSGVELKEFMDKLDTDEEFRKLVSFHNLLIDSIQFSEDNRIERAIVEQIGYKKPLIPTGLKLILTFLFITLTGIILWQYIGTGSLQSRRKIFNLDLLRKSPVTKNEVKQEDKTTTKGKVKSQDLPVESKSETVVEKDQEESQVTEQDSSDVQTFSDDENVVVKKDQLLVKHTLKVMEVEGDAEKKPAESSLAQNAASKLNPAAGLVDNSKPSVDSYDVEFWVSPVNYRGYKLLNNKLILFGIEEPDAVKLYYFDTKLMMKYGLDYFRLNPTEEFVSFSVIKNTDLPAALK